MRRLLDDELPVTQEALARMIGARRTSVSEIAKQMEKSGVLACSRGRIRIVDVAKVRLVACNCEAVISAHYSCLIGSN